MPIEETVGVLEEELPRTQEIPEVTVKGDEAVIRVETPVGAEERKVRLPKTTWG